jgi:hypothetical protein
MNSGQLARFRVLQRCQVLTSGLSQKPPVRLHPGPSVGRDKPRTGASKTGEHRALWRQFRELILIETLGGDRCDANWRRNRKIGAAIVADTHSRTGTKLNIILGHPNAVANRKAGSEPIRSRWRKCRPGPFYRVGLLVGCLQEMHVAWAGRSARTDELRFRAHRPKANVGLTARSRPGPGDWRGIKGRVLDVGWAPSGPNP